MPISGAESCCHGHTNRRLGRSTDDGAKSVELEKLGMTQEHEDRHKDQGERWDETRILD